jgi:capsular exopolysaccharide synthesis family protein
MQGVGAIVVTLWRPKSEWSAPLAIGDYVRIFRRLWWVLLLAAVIGGIAGGASQLLHKTEYTSTARLFVTTQSGTSVGDAYQNNQFSQERVFSYAGLATSEQVAARAIDQLKASITADDLRSKITAVPLPQTVLLDITAEDSDPSTAQLYANAIADQLVNVTTELETSRRGGESAAGAILVDDASFGAPIKSTGLVARIVLGAIGGLVIGIILTVILGVSDTRVRRRERIEDVTGNALIGTLVENKERDGVIDPADGGPALERLRELRTNIQFARSGDGGRPHVITVTSPSPQDGRSTTAADLAAVFAEAGHSVLLVDGDLVEPSLPLVLGLSEAEQARAAEKGLTTLLIRQSTLAESTIRVGDFRLLPAGPLPAARRQLWGDDAAGQVIEELRAQFDYVIIDTPPLIKYSDGTVPAALGDGAVLLGRIGHTKAAGLRKALAMLQTAHAELIGVVATGEPAHRKDVAEPKADDEAADSEHEGGQPTEVIGQAPASQSRRRSRHQARPENSE